MIFAPLDPLDEQKCKRWLICSIFFLIWARSKLMFCCRTWNSRRSTISYFGLIGNWLKRRAQFIYDRNYNRIGLQRRGHSPSRLLVKTLTQNEKTKGIFMEGYPEKYLFLRYYSSTFAINPQPRRRSLRSIASCFFYFHSSPHWFVIKMK